MTVTAKGIASVPLRALQSVALMAPAMQKMCWAGASDTVPADVNPIDLVGGWGHSEEKGQEIRNQLLYQEWRDLLLPDHIISECVRTVTRIS